jgi:hypothetical protein
MSLRIVYLFDSDGFFNGSSFAQLDPKTGKLLMPENSAEIVPETLDGYFYKWNGTDWDYVEKPKTAEDCEKLGVVSHSSQTAHDVELRAIFQEVTRGSETHEAKFDGEFWRVVRKPEKSAEEKAAEEKQNRIAELKRMLAETDYIVLKIAEGSATKKEYSEKIAQRQAWRTEINDLETEDSIEE